MVILCSLDHIMTEIPCKEKVVVKEEHIGLDIKETEGDLPMTHGFKFKGH
jgi:hypothetical protein